ncbi:MAG: class II glutamine amidotransferase [Thermoguttaceae bacterium]|nr:class II glutamine amidotransferase [Thermoguttaceae bacterium]
MCELFGTTGKKPRRQNEALKEFFSHAVAHRDGWGIAVFDSGEPKRERGTESAHKSARVKELLGADFSAANMLAHIRYASCGNVSVENCHPFIESDASGRRWTLIHNGSLVRGPRVDRFKEVQIGDTDSERVLYCLVDAINRRIEATGRALTAQERFHALDETICETSKDNPLNLLFYDGELFYAHRNSNNVHTKDEISLYMRTFDGSVAFSTVPLDDSGEWTPTSGTRLLAYRDGEAVFVGTNHGNYTYVDFDPR